VNRRGALLLGWFAAILLVAGIWTLQTWLLGLGGVLAIGSVGAYLLAVHEELSG
jgi:hypothetical protein